jgi:hypothetical protein
VLDVFHFDHRRTTGICLRGWFGRANERKTLGSLLSLQPGSVVRVPAKRRLPTVVVIGRPRPRIPPRLAAAAGCSGELASRIAAAAQGEGHLRVERAYAANQPAVALKLTRGKQERLTLYVSPRTYRPLVAIVAMGGEQVTARLYLSSVKGPLLRRFKLLRGVEPGPRG